MRHPAGTIGRSFTDAPSRRVTIREISRPGIASSLSARSDGPARESGAPLVVQSRSASERDCLPTRFAPSRRDKKQQSMAAVQARLLCRCCGKADVRELAERPAPELALSPFLA